LLKEAKPQNVVFSTQGMREGYYFSTLPQSVRERDPIEDVCETIAGEGHRFAQDPSGLMAFLDPLFPDETRRQHCQRYAACMLGDLYWDEHPDYRGQQAFFKTLRLPIVGFEHEDRAALALIVLYRYQRFDGIHAAQDALSLLNKADRLRVRVVGCALRLAHALTGGAPGVLEYASLRLGDETLTLTVPADDAVYFTPAFSKRLDRLARVLDVNPVIVYR